MEGLTEKMEVLTEKQKVILNEVERLEMIDNYIKRCIAVRICPVCGKGLELRLGEFAETWIYKCSCGLEC